MNTTKYFAYVIIGLIAYGGALFCFQTNHDVLAMICAFIVGWYISEGAMKMSSKSKISNRYDNYKL